MFNKRQMRTNAKLSRLVSNLDISDGVEIGRHGEIPVRRYRAHASNSSQTLVWLHGGAFSHGGLDQLESHAVAAAIARTGTAVVAVDYRRVPAWSWFKDPATRQLTGTRFPVPVEDAYDAFAAVQKAEAGSEVSFGGASAGACLAAAAAARLANDGSSPSKLVLTYGSFHAALPALDLRLRSRIRGRYRLRQFTPNIVRRMNHNYAGSVEKMNDVFAFPGGHELPILPSTFVLDADHDSLRASGQVFAEELRHRGTSVQYLVMAETTHGFLDRPSSDSFDEAIAHIDRFLRS